MDENSLQVLVIVATVVGPIVGVAIAWILSESASQQLQKRRVQQQARFDVLRELMRWRQHSQRRGVLNEVPLLFSHNSDVMKLWRDIAGNLTSNPNLTEVKMLAAMAHDVGLAELAEKDLELYIEIVDLDPETGAPKPLQR